MCLKLIERGGEPEMECHLLLAMGFEGGSIAVYDFDSRKMNIVKPHSDPS